MLNSYYGRPILFNLAQQGSPRPGIMFDPARFGAGMASRLQNLAKARGLPYAPTALMELQKEIKDRTKLLGEYRTIRQRKGLKGTPATLTRQELAQGAGAPLGLVGRYAGNIRGLF